MNVISDIAGQYKAFRALLKKMPDQETMSIGDMIDRGPESKAVVDWFMNNGKALLGNHEHMMIDWVFNGPLYDKHIWTMNGGGATLKSYDFDPGYGDAPPKELIKAADWFRTLPISWENEKYFVSHTFQQGGEKDIWNRQRPAISDKIQIAGHNAHWGLRWFIEDNRIYALSIDTSAMKQVCGVDLVNRNIFTQEYI